MSAFIGSVKGPDHNSVHDAADVWCSVGGVELRVFEVGGGRSGSGERTGVLRQFDPIAARNLAALLVRASEEVERMRRRRAEDYAKDSAVSEETEGNKKT